MRRGRHERRRRSAPLASSVRAPSSLKRWRRSSAAMASKATTVTMPTMAPMPPPPPPPSGAD
eukprot:4552413-Prymnesium_polylepis.1